MIIGMVLSFQGFVIPKPEFPWQSDMLLRNLLTVLASFLGSILLVVIFFKYVFPRIGMVVNGPYLQTTLGDAKVDSDLENKPFVGQTGIVSSALRPSGKARFNEEILDVVAEGEFIEKDQEIIISEINGNRIVVSRKGSK